MYLEIEGVFGRGVIIHNVLPVGPLMQKVVHNIYVERKMPTFIAKFYMIGEAIQVSMSLYSTRQSVDIQFISVYLCLKYIHCICVCVSVCV